MRECVIEKELVRQVRLHGGDTRKVRWIGRVGAPDRICAAHGRSCWVELKMKNKRPTMAQLKEHERMSDWGLVVFVIDSVDDIRKVLNYLMI